MRSISHSFWILVVLSLSGALAQDAAKPRVFKAVRSPEVSSDGRVTFRFYAPNAKKVALEFEGAPQRVFERNDKGVWSLTTDALAPDFYIYSFVVDGVQLGDPGNPDQKPIVTGGNESIVHVPGPASLPWERRGVPRGTLHAERYTSRIAGEERRYVVYTPPGYSSSRRKLYPVLYLLHGVMEGEDAWVSAGKVDVMLDNLIKDGKSTAMVVVMPVGYGFPNVPDQIGQIFNDPPSRQKVNMDKVASILLDEVSPLVESRYRVNKDAAHRAIAGVSMGGAQAMYIGLNHSDRFRWIGSFSAATVMYGPLDTWFPNITETSGPKIERLWMSVGKSDFLIGSNRLFAQWLKQKSVKVDLGETVGGHAWPVWRRNFVDFSALLFKKS